MGYQGTHYLQLASESHGSEPLTCGVYSNTEQLMPDLDSVVGYPVGVLRELLGVENPHISTFDVRSVVSRNSFHSMPHNTELKIPAAAAAAAAAKSLQSCPTLCDPIDSSPPGSPVPRILQARTLVWVAISFSNAGK